MKELPKCPLKYLLVLTLGKSFLRLYDTRKVPSRSRNLHALVFSVSTLGKHLPSWLLLNFISLRSSQLWRCGTSLAGQWLRLCTSTAGGTDSIPGQGTKILHAVRCGQKKQRKKILICFPCLKKKKLKVLVPSFSLHLLNFGPPLSWGKDSPPSCPVCWDEWFPTSVFNTIGKSSVTGSSQDFSGVSFYCKNTRMRGLFHGKNHNEENSPEKEREKKVTFAKGLPCAALCWIPGSPY